MAADSPNPKYDVQNTYNKFQIDCDCEDKSSCSCDNSCNVCCPIGTVAVFDDCNNIKGCLSPNDAEHLVASEIQCAEGFLKTFNPLNGEFVGCLRPEDAFTYFAQISPIIDPIPPEPTIERFNLLNGVEAINGPELTVINHDMTITVDRIDTVDPLVIQMSAANPPPAGVVINGGSQIMSSDESSKDITIDIPNTLVASVYNFNIEVVGAGLTKPIQVVLTLV